MASTRRTIGTVGFALAGLVFLFFASWIGLLRDWVEPVPGVDLTPRYPILHEEEILPDSAFDLLLRAASLPDPRTVPSTITTVPAGNDLNLAMENGLPKLHRQGLGLPLPPPGQLPPSLAPYAPRPVEELAPSPEPEPDLEAILLEIGKEPEEAFPTGTTAHEIWLFQPTLPWCDVELQIVASALDAIQPNLELARQAAAAPNPQAVTVRTFDALLPYLQDVRNLGRALALSAEFRAAQGDVAGAFADTETALRCGNILSRGGCLINHLVNIAMSAIALNSMWYATVDRDIPPEPTRKMIRDLAEIEAGLEPISESLKYEALMAADIVDRLYGAGPDEFARFHDWGLFGSGADSRMVAFAVRGLGPIMGSTASRTGQNLHACYTHIVAAMEKPYASGAVEGFYSSVLGGRRSPHQLLTTRDPVGFVLASMLLPALGRARMKAETQQLHLGLARTYLAVKLFRQEKGRLPNDLGELVPEYLEAVPGDPFELGKAVKLRVDEDGVWVVYSVGENAHDDGGDAGGALQVTFATLPYPPDPETSQPYGTVVPYVGEGMGMSGGMGMGMGMDGEPDDRVDPDDPDAWKYSQRRYTDLGYGGQEFTPAPAGRGPSPPVPASAFDYGGRL